MAEPLPVVPYPGEDNESRLVPIGVGVVIPPWNFPLAILAGMTVGPVAAGQHRGGQAGIDHPGDRCHVHGGGRGGGDPPGGDQFPPRTGRRDR